MRFFKSLSKWDYAFPLTVAVGAIAGVFFLDSITKSLNLSVDAERALQLSMGAILVCAASAIAAYFTLKFSRQAKGQVLESKILADRYETIINESSDFIVQVDDEGRYVFVNPISEIVIGLPPSRCIGKNAFDFVFVEDRAYAQRWFAGCIKNRVRHAEITCRHKSVDGLVSTVKWFSNFHYDLDGNLEFHNAIGHIVSKD